MPGIELHADFDRDGRLTGSASERTARLSSPGAVVVANLDRDQRVLLGTVSAGSPPDPDFTVATAFSRDDELVPLEVRVAPGSLAADERLVIRCSGVMHTRIRLSDAVGAVLRQRLGDPSVFELPAQPPNGVLSLTLQVSTVAGSAFGRATDLELGFRADGREETDFTLTVVREGQGAAPVDEDSGAFSVAPFILDDRLSPATRIYVAELTQNLPSVTDLRAVAAAAGVPVVVVPESVNRGDAWLQDQYQHAAVEGPNGFRQLVIHLPRLKSNTGPPGNAANLRGFVDAHFRSRDLGVHADLWDRIISINTADGSVLRLTVGDLAGWSALVERIGQVSQEVFDASYDVAAVARLPFNLETPPNWIEELRRLPVALEQLRDLVRRASERATEPERNDLAGLLRAKSQRVAEAQREVSLSGSAAATRVAAPLAGRRVELDHDTALRLSARADQMSHSAVYGGNLESTPPVPGAPLGKILVGNLLRDGREFCDPDVLRLLAKQRKQPIVEIDSSWLKVGHVDEMLAVVPHRSTGFSVLHASSLAAILLLHYATTRYQTGLSITNPASDPDRPRGLMPRLMDRGQHPVTRMFRGKGWKHAHPVPQQGVVSDPVTPPWIFRRLAYALGDADVYNVHDIGFVAGEGEDRHYRADITAAEVLWCERTNDGFSTSVTVDERSLQPSRAKLAAELGAPVLPVPVLFDRVRDAESYRRAPWDSQTTAFSPDCANLEVLNGHLVMPKPYGPRMLVDDAIDVVRLTMGELPGLGPARDRVGRRLVAQRRMTTEHYWVQTFARAAAYNEYGSIRRTYGGMQTADDVIAAFKDSFPGASPADLQRRLLRPNAAAFTREGRLRREFTRLVVADGMVDLFELFIAAVVDQLGVQLHFVDTWYYHLHDGQIHCGTNVLRRPSRGSRPHVWDAPDAEFRSQTINIEAERVPVRSRAQ